MSIHKAYGGDFAHTVINIVKRKCSCLHAHALYSCKCGSFVLVTIKTLSLISISPFSYVTGAGLVKSKDSKFP